MVRASAIIVLIALFLGSTPIWAQSESGNGRNIGNQLKRYGPSLTDSAEREKVLREIDSLFQNDTYQPLREILNDYISTALWEISGSTGGGSRVWYIWNMGYVVKTGQTVIGFDLGEVELDPLDQEQKKILGESLDILFVSHNDMPHIDADIVTHMGEDAHVVCPEGIISFFDNVPDRKVKITGMGIGERRKVGSVDVRAFEGDDRRGSAMRCYLVNIGGTRVLQTGDQHYVADWMGDLSSRIDLLMMGPMEDYESTVEAIETLKPGMVVPGGLYDMSHPKDTWSGYDYAYRLRTDGGSGVVPLFFGESIKIGVESRGGGLPVLIIIPFVVLVAVVGVIIARRSTIEGKAPAKPSKPATKLECEKRYVKRLCLKCRHYTIRGGKPVCSRYGFELVPGEEGN